MPTFLVFKAGRVADTIRGANASALRSAVARAAADAGAGGGGGGSSGTHFASKGYRLGSADEPTVAVRGVGGLGGAAGGAAVAAVAGMRGLLGTAIRFVVLYLTTLFSFDAYVAAESSPFSVKERQDRKNK
jgi:thioredoxin 1